jgi:hypothetical protein
MGEHELPLPIHEAFKTNHSELEHYCLLHQQLLLPHLSDQGPGLAVPACQSRARQSTCSTGGWLLAADHCKEAQQK